MKILSMWIHNIIILTLLYKSVNAAYNKNIQNFNFYLEND